MLWDSKKQLYREIFFLNFQQVTINVYWQKETSHFFLTETSIRNSDTQSDQLMELEYMNLFWTNLATLLLCH